jgi:hypothetical protein
MSPQVYIQRCHLMCISSYVTSCVHPAMSPHIYIQLCHLRCTSSYVTSCVHPAMSPHVYIQLCHLRCTSSDVTSGVHPAMLHQVYIQQCHLRCLAHRRGNICLIFYCMRVVVVAVTVDWDVFCCGVMFPDSFMDDVTYVGNFGSSKCSYDLWHTGPHLLWLWEFFLSSVHDDCVGFTGATPQFYSVAPDRFVIAL